MPQPRERDSLARQYRPRLQRQIQKVVSLEVQAIKRAIEFDESFKDIYLKQVPGDLKRFVNPTQWAYSEGILKATINETALVLSLDEGALLQFRQAYIETFNTRYIGSHLAQLHALDTQEQVYERLDGWLRTAASKRARDEATRMNQATFQNAKFFAGQCTTWRNRGSETCPYCKSLSGRRICEGQSFVDKLDYLEPDSGDKKPMRIYVTLHHPPAHGGCDCTLIELSEIKGEIMDYHAFKNPKIVGYFPLNVNLTIDDKQEFFDYDSFADLNSPDLVCLWSHDAKLQVASVKNKSLRVFLAGGNLNIEVLPEEDNPVSDVVFNVKMKQEKYVGISPGFFTRKKECNTDVDGSEHLVVNLNELSLWTTPVHKGSSAVLSSELDMGQLKKQIAFERRWLDDLQKGYDARIASKVQEVRDFLKEVKAGRHIVDNSDQTLWGPEKIAAFKRDHPRFMPSQRMGFETATLR